jgi:hypothetical protein
MVCRVNADHEYWQKSKPSVLEAEPQRAGVGLPLEPAACEFVPGRKASLGQSFGPRPGERRPSFPER